MALEKQKAVTSSTERLLMQAVAHHTAGRLPQAQAIYMEALAQAPEHPDVLHLLGLAMHQLGNHQDSRVRIERAIQLKPGSAAYRSNLGSVLQSLGDFDAAISSFESAIAIDPSFADAHYNLGRARQAQGNWSQALECYERVIRLNPRYERAHYNAGLQLQKLGRTDQALQHFEKALELAPGNLDTRIALANMLLTLGHTEKAIDHYAEVLRVEPGHEVASHLVASLTGTNPDRAPDGYIEKIFDEYADTFDHHLVHALQYRTPEQLAELTQARAQWGDAQLDVLDLGCGTGLSGVVLKPLARSLIGVDISDGMLRKARARNLYTKLVRSDLLQMMVQQEARSFDLVFAADVFVYLGRLDEIFVEVARLLRSGGWFSFSVEAASDMPKPESRSGSDFILGTTGRYAHYSAYLDRLGELCGFKRLELNPAQVRLEKGQPIAAWLVVMQKI